MALDPAPEQAHGANSIAIEGIDGSGKGTQAARLRDRLNDSDVKTALISFPRYDATSFGRAVGQFLNGRFGALDPGIRKDMHELLLLLWRESKLTIFMVTHDLKEGFTLGSRVLVFDKVRVDPQAPGAYGARITYNIALDHSRDSASSLHMARATVEGASRVEAVSA